ncbi:hypothetical protein [Gottfriedia acidiceleris]|uniref:hypothetical protein n=1 Tax=Gottfriedia acidiceleris TaxID=371036 RepID=UPI002FFFFB0A
MKTWEMIQQTVQGDMWYSETLGYPIMHTSSGFVFLNSKNEFHNIKICQNFLRATDWRKIKDETDKVIYYEDDIMEK